MQLSDGDLLHEAGRDMQFYLSRFYANYSFRYASCSFRTERLTRNKRRGTMERISQVLNRGLNERYSDQILRILKAFVRNMLIPKLYVQENPENFLLLYAICLTLTDDIEGRMSEEFYDSSLPDGWFQLGCFEDFAIEDLAAVLVFQTAKSRLKECYFKVLNNIRAVHPYTSHMVYANFADEILKPFFYRPRSEVTFWCQEASADLIRHVREEIRKLPRNMTQTEFLVWAHLCERNEIDEVLNAALGLGYGFGSRNYMDSQTFKSRSIQFDMNDRIAEEHEKRIRNGSFQKPFEFLEGNKTTKTSCDAMHRLYFYSNKFQRGYLQSICTQVMRKHCNIVLEKIKPTVEPETSWPPKEFHSVLKSLRSYDDSISDALLRATSSYLGETVSIFEGCGKRLRARITKTSKRYIEYLCTADEIAVEEFLRDSKDLRTFCEYLADQKAMMDSLETFVRENICGKPEKQGRINILFDFLHKPFVHAIVRQTLSVLLKKEDDASNRWK